jgi:predicted DNA-binding protein
MMGTRVYTLLTPGQKKELVALAAKQDRSVSYLIARAVKDHIGARGCGHTAAQATEKAFARTDRDTADSVKDMAAKTGWCEWQVVNAAIETYLETHSDALCNA